MTKLVSTLVLVILGVAAVGAVAPRLAQFVGALVPVIVVAGIVVAVLRVVWFYTR